MVMATMVIASLAIGTAGTALADDNGKDGNKDGNVQQLFNDQPGGLPLTSSFTSDGGTLVIFASGSGWLLSGGHSIGMGIFVDGTQVGTTHGFTNESFSHKAFVSNPLVVRGVPKGTHTLQLVAQANTRTDINDFYSVTILEVDH